MTPERVSVFVEERKLDYKDTGVNTPWNAYRLGAQQPSTSSQRDSSALPESAFPCPTELAQLCGPLVRDLCPRQWHIYINSSRALTILDLEKRHCYVADTNHHSQ